jgi:hypothetical protein
LDIDIEDSKENSNSKGIPTRFSPTTQKASEYEYSNFENFETFDVKSMISKKSHQTIIKRASDRSKKFGR